MNSILLKRLFKVYTKQLFFVGIVLCTLSIILFVWMFSRLDEITPNDVPSSYPPALLIDYWYKIKPFPYSLLLFIQTKDDKSFTLLYGKAPQQIQTYSHHLENMALVDDSIVFSATSEQELLAAQAWVQVIDNQQREIASWNKPTTATNNLSLQTLALSSSYSMHNGIAIDSYYDEKSGHSWLIHFPVATELHTFSMFPTLEPELELLLIGIAFLLIVSFVSLILLAIMYANRFMKPIAHIITRITELGHGEELSDATKSAKQNRLFHWLKKGDSKRSRKLFSEVFDSIDMVNDRIIESKQIQQETRLRRDEWIAGISHDIKTPLSTIKGYAHMLSTDKYEWTSEEVRTFASAMLVKINYMNQLLEDLSLTYMLSNNTLPVTLTEQNINDVLSDAIGLIIKGDMSMSDAVSLQLPNESVIATIHPPWLERILHNLVANALLHNPEGTQVTIQLEYDNNGWTILIVDDGDGMDEPTIALLFERYYRGTNTEQQTSGTGLGMAITRQFVLAMGGAIAVDSKPTIGTTIRTQWKR